jgi:IclR family pca regulon transcriptional regulator
MSMSLERGLGVLEVFSGQTPILRLADMAGRSGLTVPTAHRYAKTLVALGYLEQDDSRNYLLAPRSADPGLNLIASMEQTLPVLTVLEELRDETGYTVGMGVLGHRYVTYLHRLSGHRRGQYGIDLELRAGAHIPLYCTALGKALLAVVPYASRRRLILDLDFIPEGPHSIMTPQELIEELRTLDTGEPVVSDEELVVGARSIAMYVPRADVKRPIGIDVTVPSEMMTVAELHQRIAPNLVYAAKLISQTERK